MSQYTAIHFAANPLRPNLSQHTITSCSYEGDHLGDIEAANAAAMVEGDIVCIEIGANEGWHRMAFMNDWFSLTGYFPTAF